MVDVFGGYRDPKIYETQSRWLQNIRQGKGYVLRGKIETR